MSDKLKLFMWHADWTGCYWYRSKWPADALSDAGHDVVTGTVSRHADNDRLHVLQRSTNINAARKLFALNEQGVPWVYDLDDAIWALTPDNPGAEHFYKKDVQALIHWLTTNAPIVTCSTEPLADMVRNRFRADQSPATTVVLPNALPSKYTALDPGEDREHVVLWRGSATHSEDIKVARKALQAASKAGARVVFAGADYRSLAGVPDAELLPWVKSTEDYIKAIRELKPTVALIPLHPTEFNRAKSQVALLEARAAGAVPICSNREAYAPWIEDTKSGFLVTGNEWHWKNIVEDVLSEPYSAFADLVAEGTRINQEWSVEALAPSYAEVYDVLTDALHEAVKADPTLLPA